MRRADCMGVRGGVGCGVSRGAPPAEEGGSLDALTCACSSRASWRDFGARGWEDERCWIRCCFKSFFCAVLERWVQASVNSIELSSGGGSICILSSDIVCNYNVLLIFVQT